MELFNRCGLQVVKVFLARLEREAGESPAGGELGGAAAEEGLAEL